MDAEISEIGSQALDRLRVLLVDDSGLARKAISRSLAHSNIECIQADSGEAGWRLLVKSLTDEQPLDAMILDWEMPGIGGAGVLEELIKDSRFNSLAVLVFTERPTTRAYSYICQRATFHIQLKRNLPDLARRLRYFVRLCVEGSMPYLPTTGTEEDGNWREQARVLVVHQDIAVGNMYRETLGMQGYTVITAVDPAQGLEAAHQHSPHIALISDQLEPATGANFASRLSHDPCLSETTSVILAPSDRSTHLYNVLSAGAIDVWSEDEPTRVFLMRVDAIARPMVIAERALNEATTSRDRRATVLEELKDKQAKMIQTGRLASLGELGTGISHELNQPLTAISGLTSLALEHHENLSTETRDCLSVVHAQAQRMETILENVRSFSRERAPCLVPLVLADVVERAVDLFKNNLEHHHIVLVVHNSRLPVAIMGDSVLLQQAIMNVLTNARDALLENSDVTNRRIEITLRHEGQVAFLTIRDNGPGVPADLKSSIFEPFVTSKSRAARPGLGLSAASGIVSEHGGKIALVANATGGAAFSIELPSV